MTHWFSETVPEADTLFRDSARVAGAKVAHYPHPRADPGGHAIGTTAAWLGPEDAARVAVIVSGTHGIEGYAGAAIQSAWLGTHDASALAAGEALLMIHLINPWGCAWNRREDHDNIDVFRNLVYGTQPFRENPLYDAFEEGINPRAWEGPLRERADAILAAFIADHGWEGFVTAMRRGQHNHPKGMTYHGSGPSWSRHVAEAIGETLLAHAERIDVLDIHTGFGSFGEAMIISCETPGTDAARWVDARFADMLYHWGQVGMIPDHPHGPYHMWGRKRVRDFGLEFGTYDMTERFETVRANSFIHNYGDPLNAFDIETGLAYREGCYPASPEWRETILGIGLDVVARTVRAA